MDNPKKNAGIIGVGSNTPSKVHFDFGQFFFLLFQFLLTNFDIEKMGIQTSDEWISTRTGIKERRIVQNQSASELAIPAALSAIKKASLTPEKIDLIIVATSTPDYSVLPSTACVIQKEIGAKNAAAFDISAACSGFIYALTTANQFIQTGSYKNILVIGVDLLSKHVDWSDRNTCVLFGDASGAVVLSFNRNTCMDSWC